MGNEKEFHVAIDGSSWRNPRGYGRYTRGLVAALAMRNGRFRYTLVLDEKADHPVPDGVESVLATEGNGRANRLQMNNAAVALKADVFFYPTVYSYFPLFSRVPKVVAIHDTIPERFPDLIFPSKINFWLWKLKVALAKYQATRIIGLSDSAIEDLTAILNIPKDKIDPSTEAAASVFREIVGPASLAGIREEHGIPEDAKVLVYVGGFNRHKNVLSLIHAFPMILAEHPNAFLVIVGRTTGERFWDNVEDLQATARANAVASERIVFTGEISDDDLARLLNASYALVHPSFYEGFGLPPLEAMACGTPVLGSNVSSVPEVVGRGGLLFDPSDPAEIAKTTIRLLSDDVLYQSLAARAPTQAAKFSWARAAETTETSFENALAARAR